eukprot:CAMPEP_0172820932 /NCGR_PEP_ID=MMETSP1075-20121228/15597_1 /TAXON_ID=2916 /ORGANISM="Ceratium fusus, Strain PA161109" /LENGTH=309 /DNA_ID=CAMNT_0013661679 /DNA_START=19 /DNA_END=948 /DNA_ORIENTATION=-
MAAWRFAFVGLLLLYSPAAAQDVEVTDESEKPAESPETPPKTEEAKAQAADVGDGAKDATPKEGNEEAAPINPTAFADSARELQEKLAQLKGLLAAKGGGIDPALKERLDGLTKQLQGLGINAEGADGAMNQVAGSFDNKEAEKFVATCVTLSMKRAGLRRPTTLGALRQLASGKLKPEEAQNMELVRLVAACITGLSDTELKDYESGKLGALPKNLADKAAKAEGMQEVLNLEKELPGVWDILRKVAGPLYESVSPAAGSSPPVLYGLVAGIPVVLMVGFLAKKFFDMQKDKQELADKKKEKAAKKKN